MRDMLFIPLTCKLRSRLLNQHRRPVPLLIAQTLLHSSRARLHTGRHTPRPTDGCTGPMVPPMGRAFPYSLPPPLRFPFPGWLSCGSSILVQNTFSIKAFSWVAPEHPRYSHSLEIT